MALVMFMRPSFFQGGTDSIVYDGDKYIGTMFGPSSLPYQAKPGKHMFMVVGGRADFISICSKR